MLGRRVDFVPKKGHIDDNKPNYINICMAQTLTIVAIIDKLQ